MAQERAAVRQAARGDPPAQQEHWPTQLRLTRLLADVGVGLLAGSDANGAGWVIPGFALHDEFDLLAEAGLSPLAILQAATSTPARFFGREKTAGQVVPGHAADLVVLGGDPVTHHRALHDIRAVSRGGNLWTSTDIDTILERLAAAPSAR